MRRCILVVLMTVGLVAGGDTSSATPTAPPPIATATTLPPIRPPTVTPGPSATPTPTVAPSATTAPSATPASSATPTATWTPWPTPVTTPVPQCGLVWSPVEAPNLGPLYGVAARATDDAWAVGQTNETPGRTLILHWDGRQWSRVPSPNSGSGANIVRAVASLAANNVWAVGWYEGAAQVATPLILHWDGRAWTNVSTPDTGTGNAVLHALAAVAPDNIWAAGMAGDQVLLLHWDGGRWRMVSTGIAGGMSSATVISADDIWAAGQGPGSLTSGGHRLWQPLILHWDGRVWHPVPNPGTDFFTLQGIAAASRDDLWAVGDTSGGDPEGETLILHGDGRVWTEAPGSYVSTGTNGGLTGVVVPAHDDVWAIGGAWFGWIQHWDGMAWRYAPIVNPDNLAGQPGGLFGIAARSPSDIWAVGGLRMNEMLHPDDRQTTILHYGVLPCITRTPTNTPTPTPSPTATTTATPLPPSPTPTPTWTPRPPIRLEAGATITAACGTWQAFTDPVASAPPGESLAGVAACTSDDVWAVGDYLDGRIWQGLTMHWDGRQWRQLPGPRLPSMMSSRLEAVAALAQDDAWAVGSYEGRYEGQERLTLIAHWDGGAWRVVPSPNSSPGMWNRLSAVSAASANDVWAVGSATSDNQRNSTLLLHWDGGTWREIPGPNPGTFSNELYGIATLAAGDAWAVGSARDSLTDTQTLIEHWDGTGWRAVPGPRAAGTHSHLLTVAAIAKDDVWAAGGDGERTLIEHWDGHAWSIVPSPNVAGYSNAISQLAARTPDDIWATGVYRQEGEYTGRTLALHWDGQRWSLVAAPLEPGALPAGSALAGSDGLWVTSTAGGQAAVWYYTGRPCPLPTDFAVPTLPPPTPPPSATPHPPLPAPVPTVPPVLPATSAPTPRTVMSDLNFNDALHGWLIGQDCVADVRPCPTWIKATTDGGETWQPRAAPGGGTIPIGRIEFANARDGWAWDVPTGGGFFTTHDGGRIWSGNALPDDMLVLRPWSSAIWAMRRTCPNTMGDNCNLTLLRSPDNGHTWLVAPQLTPIAGQDAAIFPLSSDTAWIFTAGMLDQAPWWEGHLLVSHDGGRHWQTRVYPCGGAGGYADRLAALPDGHLWLVCADQSGAGQAEQGKVLYLSADEGQHWQQVANYAFGQTVRPDSLPGPAIWGLAARSPTGAWMTTAGGGLSGTTDGGRTWFPATITYREADPPGGPEGPIVFVDPRHGWIGGRFSLFRTTDGGTHWAELPHP